MVFSTSFASINASHSFDKFLSPRSGDELHCLQLCASNGEATSYLLEHVLLNDSSTLTDVDTWRGTDSPDDVNINWSEVERQYDLSHRAALESGRLIKRKMTNNEFFDVNSQEFDFIYIDGNQPGPAVLQDGLNAVRNLKPSGLLAFNDARWHQKHPLSTGPSPAVSALAQVFSDEISVLQADNLVWMRRI